MQDLVKHSLFSVVSAQERPYMVRVPSELGAAHDHDSFINIDYLSVIAARASDDGPSTVT